MKQPQPTIIKPIYLPKPIKKLILKDRLYHAINRLKEQMK